MIGIFELEPFRMNDDITALRSKFERMRQAILALRPMPSGDITARITQNGTMLDLRSPSQPGDGSAAAYPFDITISGTAGSYVASFRAGVINQLLPDNYLTGVAIPDTGTKYLVLNLTASNGQITTATFTAEDDPPDALAPFAGQPPTAFAILIGVVIDTIAIKVWGNGNIQAAGTESFRLQKVTPVAGQLPYDVYYTWTFAVV